MNYSSTTARDGEVVWWGSFVRVNVYSVVCVLCVCVYFVCVCVCVCVCHDSTWDVFAGKTGVEALQHSHDVLALAYRPDGKQLASATLNGDITFWDPIDGVFQVRASLSTHTHIYTHANKADTRSMVCLWVCD
jgi:WD40 repeat protein